MTKVTTTAAGFPVAMKGTRPSCPSAIGRPGDREAPGVDGPMSLTALDVVFIPVETPPEVMMRSCSRCLRERLGDHLTAIWQDPRSSITADAAEQPDQGVAVESWIRRGSGSDGS